MTKKEFLRLKSLVDKLLQKAEDEALNGGVDISTPEFQAILQEVKKKIIERQGFSLDEYEEKEKEEVSFSSVEDSDLLKMAEGLGIEDEPDYVIRLPKVENEFEKIKGDFEARIKELLDKESRQRKKEIDGALSNIEKAIRAIKMPKPNVTVNPPNVKVNIPKSLRDVPVTMPKELSEKLNKIGELAQAMREDKLKAQGQPIDVHLVDPDRGTRYKAQMTAVAHAADEVRVKSNTVKDGSGTNYSPLLDSDGHLQVDVLSGGGGGTQYSEDAAHSSGNTGTMALVVRNDTLATLCNADGDYAPLQVNADGALYIDVANGGVLESAVDGIEGLLTTIDADTGAIKTAVEIIDNAISGTEMQVDVVASLPAGTNNIGDVDIASALPAGTNAIGKLAANSGVDIGDVDVTSIAAGTNYIGKVRLTDGTTDTVVDTNGGLYVAGDEANNAVDAGNPIKVGGRAQASTAQPEEVADNDRVDALFDRNGYLRVRGDFDPKYADINDSTSGDNTIVASAGAGKKIAVWAVMVVSDGTVDVRFEDGAGGTAFTGQIPLQAREGFTYTSGGIVPLWVGTAATLLNLELSAAVNVHGSVSYSVIDD